MRKSLLLMAALSVAAFSGCGDDQVANNSLISTTTEPAGDNCDNGGLKFETGVDTNGNGELDDDEIVETEFICAGADGAGGTDGDNGLSTLVVSTAEPAGANCAEGGERVDYGVDDNGDGVLDAVEIDGTAFICNGASGAAGLEALVVQSVEAAGGNCPTGGIRVDSGVDTSDDGVLDAGEITDTSFICNGSDGTSGFDSLILITDEAAGANCTAGGIRVDSGLDTSNNGVLEAGEITDTAFVCDGEGPPPGFVAFTADDSFVVPAGVTSINAIVVGGGGGAPNGHQGGGGSGNVAMASVAVTPGEVIAVTVGAGGLGANDCDGCNTIVGNTPGGSSAFGALTAAGGETVTVVNAAGGSGGSGGGGSCNSGTVGGDGGTNGSDGGTCNQAPGTGQGDFSPLLAPFVASVLTAGAGGTGGGGSHAGGGGGGGVLIDAAGPNGQAGGASFSAQGGTGFGAGGGAGGLDFGISGLRAAGGNGADGVVYIELN